jgi:glycosyltransferase involved in cell wall biosynthesis
VSNFREIPSRPRAEVSAYACEPGKGSEPEVGYGTVLAAAREHEVWVLTRRNNLPALAEALDEHPLRQRIHLVGTDVDGLARRLKGYALPGLQWYYDRWQLEALRQARDLHRQVSFDVAHHVTFSSHWTRVGIAELDVPLVWGPVGGAVTTPLGLLSEVGLRGLAEEILREATRRTLARTRHVRLIRRRAAVILTQNPEMNHRFAAPHVRSLPHALAAGIRTSASETSQGRTTDIALIGRLVPWKAGALALRALSHIRHESVMRVYGEGPDRRRLEGLARRRGVHGRGGLVCGGARDAVGGRNPWRGGELAPTMYDESPIALAETLSLGTPLVCLDHGGPGELTRRWPGTPSVAVRPRTPERTARALALAVDHMLSLRPPVRVGLTHPDRSYVDEILSSYQLAVEAGVSTGAAG